MLSRIMTTTCALALTAGAASAEFSLHIVHINDLHSRIEPINRFDSTCSAEDNAAGECFGGVARVATMINQLRTELADENVIVLDAGDQYQGSLMYTTYKGDVEIEFMNQIGFDAMAVGNHEFDDGDEGLAKLANGVDFPVISGNIDVSASNILADIVDDHTILEVGGKKIGIISALAADTVETSSPSDAVVFADEIESLQADADALTAAGVDIIIALNHVGVKRDMAIAEAVTGIDAVVGGHSHTLFSNTEEGAMAYPTMVGNVPVVQAYAYSKYVGHLELTFDDAGNVTAATGDTILLDASVVEDAAIVARVSELAGPIEEMKTRVVAEAAEPIEGAREVCRAMECAMGNLVADAMLERVSDQGIQIAIQNGGGLRSSIDAGEITMGEVLSVAQVAGMSYAIDASAAAGSRVSDVMVGGAPIDLAATYGVVSNNYVRNGGDGYAMFEDAANAYDFGPDLADVTAEFLAAIYGGPSGGRCFGQMKRKGAQCVDGWR